MKPVFADTFYWVSLTAPGDAAHGKAKAYDLSESRPPIITTDEILTEFLIFFGRKGLFLRSMAVAATRSIFADRSVRILPQSRETFMAGLELYAARPDKGYSLIDCISMQTMRQQGLIGALTDDRHFEQEGFRALLRD